MPSYGETIRKIRLDKGISQKALYTGILSKSYAIEFEKGKHEISLKRIEQILDQLIVPLDEFLFIYRGYSLSEKEWFSARYAEYGNSNNLTGLYSLLKEYEHRKDSFSEIRSAEIRSRIRQLNEFNQERHYKKSAILVEDQLIIQQYLSNLESWTLHEIQLFANTLDFIDYQQKATYFKALTPSFEKYRNYDRGKQILCGFLTNIIYELIQDNELLLAEHLVNELHSLSTQLTEIFFKIIAKFYQGLILIGQLNPEKGQAMTQEAVGILLALDQNHQAKLFEVIANDFTQKIKVAHECK